MIIRCEQLEGMYILICTYVSWHMPVEYLKFNGWVADRVTVVASGWQPALPQPSSNRPDASNPNLQLQIFIESGSWLAHNRQWPLGGHWVDTGWTQTSPVPWWHPYHSLIFLICSEEVIMSPSCGHHDRHDNTCGFPEVATDGLLYVEACPSCFSPLTCDACSCP